ncbi:hypothetical protein LguiB_006665 [Lonicera macranthoides]
MDSGYLYFILKRYIYKVNFEKLSQETAPPVEFVVDYTKEGMPFGMGCFALNFKLYLVGGEMLGKGKCFGHLNPPGVLDITYGDQGISSKVFVYDPSSPPNQLHSPVGDIPPMIGAKANFKIATIGGKLYVLGCKPHCRIQNISFPAFECYDPSCSQWVELPEPPHY